VTVLLVSLLAGAVSTMAVTLLVRSAQPWDDAFGRYSGAHLMFHFDASKVTAEQLVATSSLPGVTAAGPPHETVLIPFGRGSQKGQVQLIGRADPGGKVDRIPLAEPTIGGNAASYLQACLDTNYVSSVGPFVERFEAEFAAAVGSRYAVACASGTAAIHLALRILVLAATFLFAPQEHDQVRVLFD